MKYFISVFLLFSAVSTRAQITLEHTYSGAIGGIALNLIQVDSGVWKYVEFSESATPDTIITFSIFNLDHSLDRVIPVPLFVPGQYDDAQPIMIVKNLFALDGGYEYMISFGYNDNQQNYHEGLRVFKEDGTTVFSCDTCRLSDDSYVPIFSTPPCIVSTDSGVKMIILSGLNNPENYELYSLPGKLPNRQSKTAGVTPMSISNGSSFPTSAYPNPSNGQVRIAYELPTGISSVDVILTTEDGREVKRYRVSSTFSDLLIEASDLPSGSYFYKLVTEKGESAAQRIVMVK